MTEVQALFAERGFVPVQPQALPVAEQIGLVANAEPIAGCSGSNLFNLAFQRRLRSAFIVASPALLHYTDQLLNQGQPSTLWYFLGHTGPARPDHQPGSVHTPWGVDLDRLRWEVDDWLRCCGDQRPTA